MILLTRLNNKPLVVNSDLIKFIEAAPDTVITLVSGEKIIVREAAEEIVAKVVEFRRQLSRQAPGATTAPDESVQSATLRDPQNRDLPEGTVPETD